VVAICGERREIGLRTALERDVRLVRFEEGRIELNLAEGAGRTLLNDLSRALNDWTGRRWVVAHSSEAGAPTLHERRKAAERERTDDAAGHPLVRAVLHRFPGAEIVDVREKRPDPPDAGTDVSGDGDPAERDE
jgi:DNA polymerase-3 subunit gamma/tau